MLVVSGVLSGLGGLGFAHLLFSLNGVSLFSAGVFFLGEEVLALALAFALAAVQRVLFFTSSSLASCSLHAVH